MDSWLKVADIPPPNDWVRKNVDILEKFKGLEPIEADRLKEIYTNLKLPADLDPPFPRSFAKTIDGIEVNIQYNKYGFPEFESNMTKVTGPNGANLNQAYKGEWNPGNRSQDLKDATTWALDNLPSDKVRKYRSPSGKINPEKIEILDDNGNWIEQTWHHHENGRDLLPVPSKIHNPTAHTGGGSIKNGTPDMTKTFDYDPSIPQ